jgi:nucleotide-binding universal stress UspA family protein
VKPKIKRILVPLDGSENSIKGLDKAIYLARQCSATITGLYVVPFYVVKSGPRIFGPYREKMLEQVRKSLTEAKIRSAKSGIVFDEKIIEGDVIATDIADFAKNKKFDLVVIASRGFGPVKEIFLGSVAYGVLHKSKIPVLLVK